MRAELELTNPSLYAQINQDIEQRVQTFTGDQAASNPSRVNVHEPIKPVLDLGRYQRETINICDWTRYNGIGGHGWLAGNATATMEKIRSAKAIEFGQYAFGFNPNGAVAIDVFGYWIIGLNGASEAVPFMYNVVAPGFGTIPDVRPILGQGFGKSPWIGQQYIGNAADDEFQTARLLNINVEWVRQGGGVTWDLFDQVLTLQLYY